MGLFLNDDELYDMTGYKSPCRQLDVLHKRGFTRAYRAKNGKVILEEAHYLAVCRGEFNIAQQTPNVDMSFLDKKRHHGTQPH